MFRKCPDKNSNFDAGSIMDLHHFVGLHQLLNSVWTSWTFSRQNDGVTILIDPTSMFEFLEGIFRILLLENIIARFRGSGERNYCTGWAKKTNPQAFLS